MSEDEIEKELEEVAASLADIDLGYSQVCSSAEAHLRERYRELKRMQRQLEQCDMDDGD